ncbi:ABC-2 type transport system permease protein [Evansella caseinilytica]|uniref:ABC-2 type transport system permease protein n=1 Tax=Evansella caseinilytica TaxID=1503961 RepID=A0A1H3Q920_9BACI|nr:ABC transporter permease [Evansella caseinilytica]SDZ09877.1 ABC-2 type transport system permease protein [Evansella caseinilytica]
MRIAALVIRILRQFIRDKRTLGLMIFAPILVLTMMHLVFSGDAYVPKLGLVDFPEPLQEQLQLEGAELTDYDSISKAETDLADKQIDGYILFENQAPSIVLEGSDPSVNSAVMKWVQEAFQPLQQNSLSKELEIEFFHGSADMGQFDYFGPVLLGFFIFFFVFLIAGVSFLRERTTGTLERLLSSPLRRWEIVTGYVLGFGIFTMLQATIIAAYSIYILGMLMEGAFGYVLLITLFLSLSALTLGIFLSAFANNELQMIQFIPIIVVPQVFFSGLFNLETMSSWLSWIGPLTPLYYAASALRDVMVRGYGWSDIYPDLLFLSGFSVLFFILNILALKKYRSI